MVKSCSDELVGALSVRFRQSSHRTPVTERHDGGFIFLEFRYYASQFSCSNKRLAGQNAAGQQPEDDKYNTQFNK